MIKLKNILTEDDTYNASNQQGEIPKLDPEADTEVFESGLDRLEYRYSLIKPKRLDMTEFKNDVRDLISIYKDKDPATARKTYYNQFFELYPVVKTKSNWQGIHSGIMSDLNHLLKLSHAIHVKGDTSNYGYRIFPKKSI